RKQFWRDLHAVTGFWIVGLALFLIVSGLPWAKFWGDYFRTARGLVQSVQSQDWTIGGEEIEPSGNEHAGHEHAGHEHAGHGDGHGGHGHGSSTSTGSAASAGRGGRGGPP